MRWRRAYDMRWTKFKDNGRNSHMQTRCHTERRKAESDVMY